MTRLEAAELQICIRINLKNCAALFDFYFCVPPVGHIALNVLIRRPQLAS